ncbi:MAG TPA: glycerol-3-phosphate 1-O-acyltransferase PlsY [Candidatus Fimadaptatus faecigallinarum]|uniref:Glycerol-3-phosphate acyltransferase n=1 Tax=Candidatus Fimadaptatus faecigallinarum TaxID=2840814 RepID=A0A9D1S461_9FIRM|nr:glycerol-3-phosphate 1-O-acyltransferase PlsY [Candidatus Fimadaptatus faecigallinarum]
MAFWVILAIVIGYALGNISTGLLISKLANGIDIRKAGSGNAGATNVLRTLGWMPSLMTFLGDAVKGLLAALIGLWLAGHTGAMLGGLAAIVGHNWPAAFGFKGGKGISTSFGVILVVQPVCALVLLAVMIVAVYLTHTVSIGSIAASVAYIVLNLFMTLTSDLPTFIFAMVVSLLALFQHRGNMSRLLKHRENSLDFSKIQRWKKN